MPLIWWLGSIHADSLTASATLIKNDLMSMSEASSGRTLLSVDEVAHALGVRTQTVYAYVSRGVLDPRRKPGDRRSWFDPEEVDAVARRGRGRAREKVDQFRMTSGLTRIEPGGHTYRGRRALDLASEVSFEGVAELLWTGRLPSRRAVSWEPDPELVGRAVEVSELLPPEVDPLDRLSMFVALFRAVDPMRHDLRASAVATTARRMTASLVASIAPLTRTSKAETSGLEPGDSPSSVAETLRLSLTSRDQRDADAGALETALVLLADHELAASTVAVRIAASYRADPYGAVAAGLGVVGGAWHGAASRDVEVLFADVGSGASASRALGNRLRTGEPLAGIGHPLYPDGDPRCPVLLDAVHPAAPAGRWADVIDVLDVVRAQELPEPNVDFALGAMSYCLELPVGTGELVFTVARMAGWIAHAMEEYERPSRLRPRAVYVGPRR